MRPTQTDPLLSTEPYAISVCQSLKFLAILDESGEGKDVTPAIVTAPSPIGWECFSVLFSRGGDQAVMFFRG